MIVYLVTEPEFLYNAPRRHDWRPTSLQAIYGWEFAHPYLELVGEEYSYLAAFPEEM